METFIDGLLVGVMFMFLFFVMFIRTLFKDEGDSHAALAGRLNKLVNEMGLIHISISDLAVTSAGLDATIEQAVKEVVHLREATYGVQTEVQKAWEEVTKTMRQTGFAIAGGLKNAGTDKDG